MMQQLIGATFGLAGLGCVAWVFSKQLVARRSLDWPTTWGTITSASLERSAMGGLQNNHNSTWAAKVLYEYEVDGRTYRGDTICSGGELNTSFKSRAEERCRQYSPGSRVQVHYDPEDRNTCCLEPVSEIGTLGYAIGGTFAVVGCLVFLSIIGPG